MIDVADNKLMIGILVVVGSVLSMGSTFLTWGTETTTALGITNVKTFTGWCFFNGEGYQNSNAYQHWLPAIVFALGTVGAILGITISGTSSTSRYCTAMAGTLGLAGLLAMGMFSTWTIFKTSIQPLYTYEMTFGYGIYLALLGFILLLIVGTASTYVGRKNN